MNTINIWAEKSSNVADAYSKNNLSATSETVTISIDDATKMKQDAIKAIEIDEKLKQQVGRFQLFDQQEAERKKWGG